ncbi:DUF3520 domain-containing protein, partial [bacterium]|nr:DUF3520 domain-containing protein [bacterium]
ESKARLINDLRYSDEKSSKKTSQSKNQEYAFLKIRYKLPDSDKSILMTTPISKKNEYSTLTQVSADIRFAAAVAAYGQILRGGEYTKDFTYDSVLKLAKPALGEDEFGYRVEFLNLLRLAKHARPLPAR